MSRPRLRVFPPLSPAVYARRGAATRPFPLDDPRCKLLALARHGLLRGLGRLGLGPGDQVLAPAYHHGSEIEAYVRAGLAPLSTRLPRLEPHPDELDRMLGDRVRALHLIHYLGFRPPPPEPSRADLDMIAGAVAGHTGAGGAA